jgi:hypothetical protein
MTLELTEYCQTTLDERKVAEGLYVEGYACPNCGEEDEHYVTIALGYTRRGYSNRIEFHHYTCCFYVCSNYPAPHVVERNYDEACSNCNHCENHCSCSHCDRCSETVDQTCSACERCDDCCRCTFCEGCGDAADSVCGDCTYCEYCGCECANEIESYNHVPSEVFFHGEGVITRRSRYGEYPEAPDSQTYLGLEIEMEAEGDSPNELALLWKGTTLGIAKSDGSLSNGVECVTYPHTYEALCNSELTKTLNRLGQMGARAWGTGTCGLHVHVSRKTFGNKAHLWRFVSSLTDMQKEMKKLAGRDSEQWANWNGRTRPSKVVAGKGSQCGRYVAINLENEGTVELRFWRGTLRPESVLGTAATVDGLVQWTRKMTFSDVKKGFHFGDFIAWSETSLPVYQHSHILGLCEARNLTV